VLSLKTLFFLMLIRINLEIKLHKFNRAKIC
jgi:hypothetical protein